MMAALSALIPGLWYCSCSLTCLIERLLEWKMELVFTLLVTPVLLLLWQVNISAVKSQLYPLQLITTWQKTGRTEERNREERDLARNSWEEEKVFGKSRSDNEKEVFGEFVCLKPLLRWDSNILEEIKRKKKTRQTSGMRDARNGRGYMLWMTKGGMNRGNRQGKKERRHAGLSRDRRIERQRWRGKALKQKWWHAVISTGLKACQDLTLLVQLSVCHCSAPLINRIKNPYLRMCPWVRNMTNFSSLSSGVRHPEHDWNTPSSRIWIHAEHTDTETQMIYSAFSFPPSPPYSSAVSDNPFLFTSPHSFNSCHLTLSQWHGQHH